MGTASDDGPDAGVDSRQVLLVALCLFGLVTASFLAPVTGSNPTVGGDDGGLLADILGELVEFLFSDREPENPDGGEGGSGGEGGGGGSIPEWFVEILREILEDGDGDGGSGEADCQVLVEQNPTPGDETTVRVFHDDQPESGVAVWFNDQYVGETDEEGRVTGQVPYEERLNVTVQSDETCAFSRRPAVSGVSGVTGRLAPTTALSGPLQSVLVTHGIGADGTVVAQTSEDGVNSSNEVQVDSDARVELIGEPYPNSTIELVVRAGNAPIPDANVSVDGQRVGQTDAFGRYTLEIPDRDTISITVSRGGVSGSTTIDIWQLRLGFVTRLTVPGERVTANVSTPGGPVSDASVTVDGRQVGTTASSGRVNFTAPATVDGVVGASTSRQSTTVPLWRIYAVTAGASALLVVASVVSTAVTARRSGRGRAKRVAAWWAAVATLFVGYAVWELLGLLGALVLIAVVWLYRNREAVLAGSISAAATTGRMLVRCQHFALGVVSGLETLADIIQAQTARFVAWLRTLPRSLSGLATRLGAWLGRLPGRLRTAGASLSIRMAAAVVLALVFVVGATLLLGAPGFVLSVALVVLAFLAWLAMRYISNRETDRPARDPAPTSDDEPLGAVRGQVSLRELWRRVARWVLPETWQTRTPAEISRAAIDAGLPSEPVERLTEAFRDVEYGGASETAREDDAWRAYESLEAAGEDDQ